MKKRNVNILACVLAVALCLCGCTKPQSNSDPSVVASGESTYTSDSVIPSTPESTPSVESIPSSESSGNDQVTALNSWKKTSSGDGELHYSITNSYVVTNVNELDTNGFLETAYVCRYGSEEPTEYYYPEFIGQTGDFVDGIKLIVLDITVSNPEGATSRYKDSQGNWVDHFVGNPYLFTVGSGGLGLLLDLNHCLNTEYQMYRAYPPHYFSERNCIQEREDGFILKPGETISFQIGYLICNRENGEDIDVAELVFGTSNSLKTDWIVLGLNEAE